MELMIVKDASTVELSPPGSSRRSTSSSSDYSEDLAFVLLAGTRQIDCTSMPVAVERRYAIAFDRALSSYAATLFGHRRIRGTYIYDDGSSVTERSLMRAGVLPATNLVAFRRALASTAVAFHQEAIGLLLHSRDMPSIVRAEEASTAAEAA